VAGLNAIEGIQCQSPKGAFYVFPEVTEACRAKGFRSSRELQHYLLFEGKVAVLHRECFGRKLPGETREFIRLSYATSRGQIEAGLERIERALRRR
jgi:aspartate aminotransferase